MGHNNLLLWMILFLAGVFAVTQIVKYPGHIAWKVVKSGALGCLMIFAVNWIGGYLHFHLPFNPWTALTAGFLGIPGLVALVVLQVWVFR